MAIQMILCVETKKSADTDSIYILDTISRWYKVDNKVKISKINMNSKSRYNSKDVVREIAKKEKEFVLGDTHVIYFIDTDQYERNPEHEREWKEISYFCESNGFDLVWFCHDVEEVFWGHKVSDSQKVQEATAFIKKKRIGEVIAERLSCTTIRTSASNILKVFDKYLERK